MFMLTNLNVVLTLCRVKNESITLLAKLYIIVSPIYGTDPCFLTQFLGYIKNENIVNDHHTLCCSYSCSLKLSSLVSPCILCNPLPTDPDFYPLPDTLTHLPSLDFAFDLHTTENLPLKIFENPNINLETS